MDIAGVWDDLEYEHYTLEEPTKTLPRGIIEAQPVIGRRIITVHIQPGTSDSFNILIAGNSWNYRTRLDARGVSGADFNEDGSDGDHFEVIQKMSEPALTTHPETGQPVRRVPTLPNLPLNHSDAAEKTKKLLAEIANGRLAMMAIIGMRLAQLL